MSDEPCIEDKTSDSESSEAKTPWHFQLVTVLEETAPKAIEVISGFQLTVGPLSADVVLIRRAALDSESIEMLPGFYRRLSEWNLVEYKSPAVHVTEAALHQLFSYGHRFRMQERGRRVKAKEPPLPVHEFTLFLLVDHLSRGLIQCLEEYGGSRVQEEKGIWKVEQMMFRFYIIELRERGKVAQERLFQLCTTEFDKSGSTYIEQLSDAERKAFWMIIPKLHKHLEGPMIEPSQDVSNRKMTLDEAYRQMLAQLPLKEVMAYHTIEEVVNLFGIQELLKAVPSEDRIKGMSPQELLKGMSPQELLKGMSPQELLKAVPSEERLKGMSLEDRLKGISLDELDRLKHLLP